MRARRGRQAASSSLSASATPAAPGEAVTMARASNSEVSRVGVYSKAMK